MEIFTDGVWTVFMAFYTLLRFVAESALYLFGVSIGVMIIYILLTTLLIAIGCAQAFYLYAKERCVWKRMVEFVRFHWKKGLDNYNQHKGVK